MKIRIVSNLLPGNIDEIKLASLYFDEIEILKRIQVEDMEFMEEDQSLRISRYPLYSQSFIEQLQVLENENIVSYSFSTRVTWDDEDRSIDNLDDQVKDVIQNNANVIFPSSKVSELDSGFQISISDDGLIANEEAEIIYNNHLSQVEKMRDFGNDDANKAFYIINYYTILFGELLASLNKGQICLTASSTLHALLKSYYHSNEFLRTRQLFKEQRDINPSILFEALRLAIPDVSKLTIHDILEIREKANDELIKFREHIDRINFEIEQDFDRIQIISRADDIVNAKITPALNDLTNKISGLKYSLPKKFLDELKDPKSYSPLLATFVAQVPVQLAILCSLGLVGVSLGLEYLETMKDAKNNGLYYLLKLQKHVG